MSGRTAETLEKHDPATLALQALQKPISRYLWVPRDAIVFTPQVLPQTFGDGRALFRVTTINNRPAYWIVRGCSTWASPGSLYENDAPDGALEFVDFIDEISYALEEEFGSTKHYEQNARGQWFDPDTGQFIRRIDTTYPVVRWEGGCSWDRMRWPVEDMPGFSFEPHPLNSGVNLIIGHEP
jgi:hypothetical protein